MRLVLFCLAIVLGLTCSEPASAQGFPPGPWRGVWTSSDKQFEYQSELDFTVELNGQVRGQFRWMLVRSPNGDDQTLIGLRGTEYVEGQLDIGSGALTLRGIRIDDPNHVITADEYRLIVSPDGQHIVGMSRDTGSWGGRLELTRFGPG